MRTFIRSGALVALLAAAACGSPKPPSDTAAAVPNVDTVKPVPAQVTDSMAADSTKAAAEATAAKATNAKTTRTKARADTAKILGRDSVIMPKGKGGLPPVKRDTNPQASH